MRCEHFCFVMRDYFILFSRSCCLITVSLSGLWATITSYAIVSTILRMVRISICLASPSSAVFLAYTECSWRLNRVLIQLQFFDYFKFSDY